MVAAKYFDNLLIYFNILTNILAGHIDRLYFFGSENPSFFSICGSILNNNCQNFDNYCSSFLKLISKNISVVGWMFENCEKFYIKCGQKLSKRIQLL